MNVITTMPQYQNINFYMWIQYYLKTQRQINLPKAIWYQIIELVLLNSCFITLFRNLRNGRYNVALKIQWNKHLLSTVYYVAKTNTFITIDGNMYTYGVHNNSIIFDGIGINLDLKHKPYELELVPVETMFIGVDSVGHGERYKRKFHGFGEYYSSEGAYKGEFSFGVKTGFGHYQNEYIDYIGQFKNDEFHGSGVKIGLTYKYVGQFEYGYESGFGTYYQWINNMFVKRYEGESHHDKFNGHPWGLHYNDDGNSVYSGADEDGSKNGYGY